VGAELPRDIGTDGTHRDHAALGAVLRLRRRPATAIPAGARRAEPVENRRLATSPVRTRPRWSRAEMRPVRATYLLLNHYRGGPAPVVDVDPVDRWTGGRRRRSTRTCSTCATSQPS